MRSRGDGGRRRHGGGRVFVRLRRGSAEHCRRPGELERQFEGSSKVDLYHSCTIPKFYLVKIILISFSLFSVRTWWRRSGWFLGGFGATSGGVLRRSSRRIRLRASDVKMTVVDPADSSRFRFSHAAKEERWRDAIVSSRAVAVVSLQMNGLWKYCSPDVIFREFGLRHRLRNEKSKLSE